MGLAFTICSDCHVNPGQPHAAGCDVAQCPDCGRQRLDCAQHTSTSPAIWTGLFPGLIEASREGWWHRPDADQGWAECAWDAPGARPNVARVVREAEAGTLRWDRAAQLWVRPTSEIPPLACERDAVRHALETLAGSTGEFDQILRDAERNVLSIRRVGAWQYVNLWFSLDSSDKPHLVETNNGPAADSAVLWQNPDW
ncbi:hypothetical protein [Nonomuraea sp. NPDC049646]|uniref:hypothetical protein n=1 Tax=unclassified Nonomuraea TaxID=2593643 RepID=UPI0037B2FC94